MKKQLFLLLALMASVTVSAQNLALNGTVLTPSPSGKLAVDGDAGTRWESAWDDNVTWQLDLGTAKDFNTIQIVWQDAYAKSFVIEAGNTVGTDGYITDGTKIVEEKSQTLSGFPNTQNFTFTKTNARYIKLSCSERPEIWGNKYGYSIWEFRVFNVADQTLKNFSVTPTTTLMNAATTAGVSGAGKVGTAIPLTVSAKDENDVDYPTTGITYAVTGVGGTVADGAFTPSAKGFSTITATLGDKTAEFSVYAYDGDNLALNKTVDKSGEVTDYAASKAVDGDFTTRWASNKPADNSVVDYNAYLSVDLGAAYDIDYVDLMFENANSDTYTLQFSADGSTWKDAYSETGLGGYKGGHYGYYNNTTDNKGVRYVKVNSTKAGTSYGISIYELQVFGSASKTTGINTVNAAANEGMSSVYNMSGCRVNKMDKQGLYIVKSANGYRKVIKR